MLNFCNVKTTIVGPFSTLLCPGNFQRWFERCELDWIERWLENWSLYWNLSRTLRELSELMLLIHQLYPLRDLEKSPNGQ
ncbi:hypothetical protein LEMLEM_LOCUS12059, partial [Lemmus lemmus]